ncbi:hypothetical protein AC790_04035 [Pantoea sp. RIT-PI-b]|uniref:hypothetical protein n=1 Tax=unclassified Pantoea TaxID=2630326 RepID=UPI000270D9D9|nr:MULTISPECIES: hypothetical protein [unclassified Pantoea]EJL90688.1 hypothetical protein PMI17_01574 [Pantoea sp. GM01]KNC15509.1 hypothetical protein AC790_04035 [Pantoea sp. RIT-PI-b]
MSLNPQDFTVYDIQAFPLVCLNQQAVLPGYASQWEAEMLALLQQEAPFVVVYDHMRVEETEADRRQRGDWLIRHRQLLSQRCKGMLSIESEASRCAELRKMRKMFGIPHQVVSSRTYALAQMQQWLARAQK